MRLFCPARIRPRTDFLRADATGDCGQGIVFAQLGCGGEIVARINEGYNLFDFYADRAIDYAGGFGAGKASRGFSEGFGGRQAEVYFFKVAATDLGR